MSDAPFVSRAWHRARAMAVRAATRADVAAYFKTPALAGVGFRTTVPAADLAPGAHTVVVRVITADGRAYDESPPIAFSVK